MSGQSAADRNLLFGVLALQMDFLTRDQLIEGMQAWVLEKSKPLEEILVAKRLLAEAHRDLLSPLVQAHISQHRGDAEASLKALSANTPVVEALAQIPDPDVQNSLMSLHLRDARMADTDSYRPEFQAGMRFLALRPHAKGGLGEVFVARDTELDREVALKEIQGHHAHDPHSKSRFVMEAEITGKLEHPGIVPVYGLGTYPDGRPFYAMRFIRSDSLHEAIKRFHQSRDAGELGAGNPFESVEFRKLLGRFVDVCQAVCYAHARGVLHRDLKPGNIMLGKHGETLVVDWGLAKLKSREEIANDAESLVKLSSGSNVGETLPGSAIGTPAYMSPEQAEGRIDQLGPATDIYGLGATLFTLLTNQKPVKADHVAELLRKTAQGEIRQPRAVNPQIPKPLEAICQKAMALSPGNRYANCEAFAEDLERFLAGEKVTAYPEPWTDRARRFVIKHRILATSALVAVSVAVLGLAIGLAVVTGLNDQLDEQNTKLVQANETEKSLRQLAEQREQEAQTAKTEAERQSNIAKNRLEQANEVASELIFTVDRKLANIPAASAIRRELLDRAQKLLESLLVEAQDDPATLWHRAGQLIARGDVAMRYEDLGKAQTFYEESFAIHRKLLAADPTNAEAQHDLSVSLDKVGDLATTQGDLGKAQTYYQESLAIRLKLSAADPTNAKAQRDLLFSFAKLGVFAQMQNEWESAAHWFREGIDVLDRMIAKGQSVSEARRFHSDLTAWLRHVETMSTMAKPAIADKPSR